MDATCAALPCGDMIRQVAEYLQAHSAAHLDMFNEIIKDLTKTPPSIDTPSSDNQPAIAPDDSSKKIPTEPAKTKPVVVDISSLQNVIASITKVTLIGSVRGVHDVAVAKDKLILLPSGKEFTCSKIFAIPQISKTNSNNPHCKFLFVIEQDPSTPVAERRIECIQATFKEGLKMIDVQLLEEPTEENGLLELQNKLGQQSMKLSGAPNSLFFDVLSCTQKKSQVIMLNSKDFVSGTGSLGVTAYNGVNDGTLYPCAQGYIFLQKPCMFIPSSAVEEFHINRSGSRAFDFSLKLRVPVSFSLTSSNGAKKVVFTMIDASEMSTLAAFAKESLRNNKPSDQVVSRTEEGAKDGQPPAAMVYSDGENSDADSNFSGDDSSDEEENPGDADGEVNDKDKEEDGADSGTESGSLKREREDESGSDSESDSGSEASGENGELVDEVAEDLSWARKEGGLSSAAGGDMEYRQLRGNKRIKMQ